MILEFLHNILQGFFLLIAVFGITYAAGYGFTAGMKNAKKWW